MIRDKGVDVSTLPGLLDMADQVRYIMYKVIIEDCSRPERGFTGRETYRLQIKKKKTIDVGLVTRSYGRIQKFFEKEVKTHDSFQLKREVADPDDTENDLFLVKMFKLNLDPPLIMHMLSGHFKLINDIKRIIENTSHTKCLNS